MGGRAPQFGDEPTALQDFASWVRHLPPSRVIYSSHLSQTADLYLKLHIPHVDIRKQENVLVAFAFVNSTSPAGLTGSELYQIFVDAIGEPSWWGVKLISLI